MTPTEQDKGLREALYTLLKTDPRADTYVIPYRVMDIFAEFITADRKRVALEARREATEMFKYLYENQVSDTTAMYAALAGSEKRFKEGVHVTLKDGSRPVIFAEGVNLSLPEFFYTQLAGIDAELKAQQEEQTDDK